MASKNPYRQVIEPIWLGSRLFQSLLTAIQFRLLQTNLPVSWVFLAGSHARDALKITDEFDVLETDGSEEGFDVGLLAEAEFKDEVAAGDQCCVCGGNQAAIDFEAIASAEECNVWFVLAHLDGDESAVCVGDVGRVGNDDFESLAGDGVEEVALEETDFVSDVVVGCVLLGDGESGLGDVDGGEGGVRELSCESDDDGA